MNFLPNRIYYVTNEGNNRQHIFREQADYFIFLELYKRAFPVRCDTLAWCLLPSRFQLMIRTDERCTGRLKQGGIYIDPVTNSIRRLLSGYARIFNHRYNQTGSVFRQKTKARCLTDMRIESGDNYRAPDYYGDCFRHIHQAAMNNELVKAMEDWEFSSYRDYAGLRFDRICRHDLAMEVCEFKEGEFRSFVGVKVEDVLSKQVFV